MTLPSSTPLPQVGHEIDEAAAIDYGNGSRLNSRLVLILAFWVTTLLSVVHFGVRNVWDGPNDAAGKQLHPGENDRMLLRPLRRGGVVELSGHPLIMIGAGNNKNVLVVYKPMGSIETHDRQHASVIEAESALAEEVLQIETTKAPSVQPTHAPSQIPTAEPTQRPSVSPTPSLTARVTLSVRCSQKGLDGPFMVVTQASLNPEWWWCLPPVPREPFSQPTPAPTPAPATLPPTTRPTAVPTAMPTAPAEPPVAASEPEHVSAAADPAPSNTAEPTPSKCESLTSLEHSCLERALEHLGGTAWDGGVVDMRINGGMANTMFDVVFGAVLADMLNYTLMVQNVLGSDHPVYQSQVSTDQCANFTEITQMSPVYCDEIVEAFQRVSQPGHCVTVHDGYWQRYSMYQHHKDLIKPMFHVPRFDDTTYSDPGPNDIVIHARWEPAVSHTELQSLEGIQSDLFYPQLTWEYYEQILSRTAPYDKLWVIAMPQLKEHALLKKLQTTYGAIVRSVDQFDDFHFVKRGRRIIMAASTFSWWAAFLSQATEIHYPLAGIFHPAAQLPDFEALPPGELTVFDEDRYIFHDLIARKWWGHFDVCSDSFIYEHQ